MFGAHPATPRTQEENECARDASLSLTRVYFAWLGYRGGQTEDSFVGTDGCGPLAFRNWDINANQPDLVAADNCVTIDGYGRWFDAGCNAETGKIVCQLENCHRPECD